ncbi:hypothetical protein AGMMS50256_19770 [Betaproteobacteria bacterium]|nr:hypothetical protein AGMMS50256_19770 [Betaproteobacteria bacterium]
MEIQVSDVRYQVSTPCEDGPRSQEDGGVKNAHRQTGGVSLLTLAILLLLLGGTLALGVNYFRAGLPSTDASREREALLWADKAIIGFASTYHRLPCPAASPNGAENCGLAKGWLPNTLNLDISAFGPGHLPMRYMVYRDESTLGGVDVMHRAPSISDGTSSGVRPLPHNAFEPGIWDYPDTGANSDITAIAETAFPQNIGRYTGRFDPLFGARNGLDMCETLRLVRVKLAKDGPSAAFAHYTRSGAPVNVAYGLALPGRFNADGANNTLFDGANANGTPAMEAPDRNHSANYDDFVFTRDVDSLMSAFGCQPVRYHAVASYKDDISKGSGLDSVAEFITTLIDATIPSAPDGELDVAINREGIAVPMLESVQSVALAYGVVEEVNGQYEDLKAAVTETIIFASIQAGLSVGGVLVSTAGLIADAIGVAEAAGIAAACLGLCVNEYVAMALYAASAVVSTISLSINLASTGILIGAAANAGLIGSRLDLDLSDELETICEKMDTSEVNEEIDENEEIKKKKKEAEKNLEDARKARNKALEEWNKYYETNPNFKKQVEDCNSLLSKTGNDGLWCFSSEGSMGLCSSSCASASYSNCFGTGPDSANPTLIAQYAPFVDDSITDLYQVHMEAEQKVKDFERKIAMANKKIEDTDTDSADVQKAIADAAKDACKGAKDSDKPTCEAGQRTRLTEGYSAQHSKAENERNGLDSQLTDARTVLTNAKNAIENAHEVPAPALVAPARCPETGSSTLILCNIHYLSSCGPAHDSITQFYRDYKEYDSVEDCLDDGDDDHPLTAYECEAPAYEMLWALYQQREAAYQAAQEQYEKISDMSVDTITCNSTVNGDGNVVIWTSDAAKEIVRRVDKRSVLQ